MRSKKNKKNKKNKRTRNEKRVIRVQVGGFEGLRFCNIIDKGIAGYGVFAGKDYNKDDIVEICPFIEINNMYLVEMNEIKNPLNDYVFRSHLSENHSLVIFGNGSLFNHSEEPNVYYHHDNTSNRLMYYNALKDIKEGEEMFINYGPNHQVSLNKDTNDISVGSTY